MRIVKLIPINEKSVERTKAVMKKIYFRWYTAIYRNV